MVLVNRSHINSFSFC